MAKKVTSVQVDVQNMRRLKIKQSDENCLAFKRIIAVVFININFNTY